MRTRAPMRRVVLDRRAAPDDAVARRSCTRSRTTREVADDRRRRASVVPAKTIAPVEIVQPSPIDEPRQRAARGRRAGRRAPGACRAPRCRRRRVPAPIEQPSCTTTLAPNSTPSPISTSSPTCRFGPRGSARRRHARAASTDAARRRRASAACASSTSTTARPSRPLQRGVAPLADGVDELLALEAQRLVVRDARDRDVAEAHAHVLAVGVGARRQRDALVVDRDLAVGLHVVEHDHLLRADDRQLARLVRVEPGQVQVRDDAGGELEVAEDDVLDAGPHVALAARLQPRSAARRRGRAARRRRARRGSRARSRRRAPCRGSRGCRRGSRCSPSSPESISSRTARERRVEEQQVPDHQPAVGRLGGLDELAGVRRAERASGFSTNTCLPAASARRPSGWCVGTLEADGDRVERRIVQQVVEVGR